jgi:cell division protein FtsL
MALHRPALPFPRGIARPRTGSIVAVGAAVLLIVVAMLQVNQFSRLTSKSYEINDLNRLRAARQAQNQQLEAEVAWLSSLARVDLEARTQLGMVPANRTLYLTVNAPLPQHQTLPPRILQSMPATEDAAPSDAGSDSFLARARGWLPF